MSGIQSGAQAPLPPGPLRPGLPEGGLPEAGGLLRPGGGPGAGMMPPLGGMGQMGGGMPPPMPQMATIPGTPPQLHHVFANLVKGPSDYDLPDDVDESIPPQMKPFAAGLRPAVQPPGIPWQQEYIYEVLGKTDSEIATTARYFLQIAQQYNDTLSSDRVLASRYYSGAPFGDEVAGRSQLVMTVVRDTVRSVLPSMLRVFTGVEDPVLFEPISNEIAGDDRMATVLSRQATDYCRWALMVANDGWQVLHDALLDALVRKAGWVRWHWGERNAVRTEVCENLLMPQLQMLLAQPGAKAQRLVRRPMSPTDLQLLQKIPEAQMYLSQGGAAEYWSATITRQTSQSWPIIQSVPSESVWIVADAATVADARAVFQVRDVTAGDLIEMGLPADQVLRHASSSSQDTRLRTERTARDYASGSNTQGAPPNDRSMSIVRYAEGWIRCDADNDHRAELLHVHMLGNGGDLIQWDRCDEIPLACFTPFREPGRVIGLSLADMVMDLQRTESRVMRATLDGLAQSMFPRTVVTIGQVNMADVRQTAIGSIIRASQAGAVTELVKPFSGQDALPVLEVLESVRQSRTGITRASQGLTINELQSTAPVAVEQQTSAAQDRLDMMARTLAETGLAPLYSGLLKMMARQQDRPNVIRLRGEWMTVDPRALATQWQASVNVGGKGMPAERLAMLAQIAGKQEILVQQGGLNNPLVGLPEYRNTLARMLETGGIGDVSSYFKPLDPGWKPPPDTPPPPDPSLILAQVQQVKTSADLENTRAEAQTKRAMAVNDDDRERSQAALNAWVQAWNIAAQHSVPMPSLQEFQAAMKTHLPPVGLLPGPGAAPPPTSPAPPATSAPQQPPQPPSLPGVRPPGMVGPSPMSRPPPPSSPPPMASAAPGGGGGGDMAGRMAAMQGLQGRGMPTAYGQIANRAALSSLFGPGGPRLPPPGGGPGGPS